MDIEKYVLRIQIYILQAIVRYVPHIEEGFFRDLSRGSRSSVLCSAFTADAQDVRFYGLEGCNVANYSENGRIKASVEKYL